MSTDLFEQLAQYGADHRARQAPLDRHEILTRVRELTEIEDDSLDEEPTTRSWLVLAAAAIVAVLVAGTALVIVGRDATEPSDVPGTDLIRTTEPTVPSTSIDPSPAPSPSTTSPTTTTSVPGADTPAEIPSIRANTLAGEPIAVSGTDIDELGELSSLVAWDDGFLYVAVVGGVQMAVELSDEMFSRFPIEVQQAYPEQLVGPLGHVIARLQADGLVDEVQAALAADPELDAAVRSGPTTPIELVAEFTVDGETWTPVELVAPAKMDVVEIFVVADRLVVIGAPPPSLAATPFRTLIVASTENLQDWTVQTIPDVVEVLDEVSIAANDFGWLAHIEPDWCEADDAGSAGCSSPPVPAYGYDVGEGPPLTWVAAWGGEPRAVDGAVAQEGVTVAALQSGFIAQHEQLEFSTDGFTWAVVPGAPRDISIKGASPLDDGRTVVFAFSTTCRSEIYRVSQDGQLWERIELDLEGAGPSLLPNSGRRFLGGSGIGARSPLTSALLIEDAGPPIVSTGMLEEDGLRLTRTMCWDEEKFSERFELVDIESQRVLAAEGADGWTVGPGSLIGLIETEEVVTVLDSTTGETLAVLDSELMSWTDVGVGPPRRGEVWLMTTENATDWQVDDLTDFATDQEVFMAAARNGDTVLVGSGDGWLRYETP